MTISAGEKQVRVSIIIVNYNSGELLQNCIGSLYQCLEPGFEIIVYDNASNDSSIGLVVQKFGNKPEIKIIRGDENLGFAKANNLGAKQATGEYLHFLNPDIVVNKTLAEDYKKILSASAPAIYVTSLTDAAGNLQKNKHLIPRIGNMARYLFRPSKANFWNLGASIIIQSHAFFRMGGWPEDYFMYAEDLDFFFIAGNMNIRIHYIDTRLIHIGKGVTHQVWSSRQRAEIIEKSFKKYYRKYGAGWEYLLIRPVQLFYLLVNEPGSFPLYFKTFFYTLFKK